MKTFFEILSMVAFAISVVLLVFVDWEKAILFYVMGFRFEWKASQMGQREEAKRSTHLSGTQTTTTVR